MIKANRLIFASTMIWIIACCSNGISAEQSRSLERLLDDFQLHQQSRSAAVAVSEKIYEMAEHRSYPTVESIKRISLLLESADSQIADAGASAVAVLGKKAWPIRLDIWKLYFRIVDKSNKLCKFSSKGDFF
jgi:hypothetical protein